MTVSPPPVALRDLLQRNPFRTLGLPGEATWSEILQASERIRGRSWIRPRTPWDLPLLGPVRREVRDVELALARLAEPDLRLLDRMFWFHDRDSETAVGYLTPSSIRDALEGWSATALSVARHDAAIVALVAASSLDVGVEDVALWRRAIREWADLIENEEYWLAFMKAELTGGFERLASLGDVRDLRESTLCLVTDFVISRAREMLIAAKPGQAIRAVEMLRDELPSEVFDEMCGDLARVLGIASAAARNQPAAPKEPEPRPQVEPSRRASIDETTPWWVPLEERKQVAEEPAAETPAPVAPAASSGTPVVEPAPSSAPNDPAATVPAPIVIEREPTPAPSTDQPASVERSAAISVPPLSPPPEREATEARRETGAVTEEASPAAAQASPVTAETLAAEVSVAQEMTEVAPIVPHAGRAGRVRHSRGRTFVRSRPSVGTMLYKAAVGLFSVAMGLVPFLVLLHFAEVSSQQETWVLDTRIELNDNVITDLAARRAESKRIRDSLAQDLTESWELLTEYERRIEQGLPHDPLAYLRLQRYHKATETRYVQVLVEDRDLAERYNTRLRRRERLLGDREIAAR